MPDIKIRRGSHEDLDWLADELSLFSGTYGTRKPLFKDRETTIQRMANVVENHVVFVAEREGERMGFIAGFITEHPYNPDIRVLAETFWWVIPRYRQTKAGSRLLDSFIAYGRANVDWVTFGTMNTTHVRHNSLVRRGFDLKEQCFLLEV